MGSTMPVRILAEAGSLGAQVAGAPLDRALPASMAAVLRSALARHGVLVFRGQDIDDVAHARFARVFGEPASFEGCSGFTSAPEIYRAANADAQGRPIATDSLEARLLRINWHWHIDGCYRRMPNHGVVLRCVEAVEGGGETVFADLAGAYERLPSTTRRRIDGLRAVFSFAAMVGRCGLPALSADEASQLPPVEHPLVRQHADGRRSLFLSPPYMERVVGWDVPASARLFEDLTAHATEERGLYRHRWRQADVVVWDNGWTMHRVTPYDIGAARRVMHGATIPGTEPVRPVPPAPGVSRKAGPTRRAADPARG